MKKMIKDLNVEEFDALKKYCNKLRLGCSCMACGFRHACNSSNKKSDIIGIFDRLSEEIDLSLIMKKPCCNMARANKTNFCPDCGVKV